jgi:hypothetical protein
LSEREKLKPEKRSSSHFEENNRLDDVYEVIHVHVLSLNPMLVPVLKRPKGLGTIENKHKIMYKHKG